MLRIYSQEMFDMFPSKLKLVLMLLVYEIYSKFNHVVGYLSCCYSLQDSSGTAPSNTIFYGLLQSLLPKMLNSSSIYV